MTGLTHKFQGANIFKFQTALYKNSKQFRTEIENLPIRNDRKTTYAIKMREAIENGLPSLALKFADLFKNETGYLMDQSLVNIGKLCLSPTNAILLRSAFGEPDNARIFQLCERLIYLTEIKHPKEELKKEIITKVTTVDKTLHSDYLGLCLLMNSKYVDLDIGAQVDVFNTISIQKYLMEYVLDIERTNQFPNNFKEDAVNKFKYFGEGIKKWSFVDYYVDEITKNRIRNIVFYRNDKELENFFSEKSNESLFEDLKALVDYVAKSLYFYNAYRTNYKCEV